VYADIIVMSISEDDALWASDNKESIAINYQKLLLQQ